MPQLHIPTALRGNPDLCALAYGKYWRKPKILADIDAIEAIFGPPRKILDRDDFRSYQAWMSQKIIDQPILYLGAEMGLGKTAATLWGMKELYDAGTVKKVLIVAPLNVAENTWPEEIAKWRFARGFTYTVITGDEDERIAALQYGGDIHIINRENLVWLKAYWGRRWPYDMLVYDEASRLKAANKKTKPTARKDGSFSAKRISEFGVLSRMRGFFKRIVLLSGTPAPNGLVDLWGPIYICDKGARLGKSKTAYLDRWFKYDQWKRKHTPFEHSQPQIMGAISDIFYSLRESDYLKLPKLIVRDHDVPLPAKAMDLYRRFQKEMVLEEFDLEAVNNGVLTNKLLQLANGSLYLDDKSAKHIHDAKLDTLESIMEESYGHSVLVAYSYQFDKERIKKRFPYVRIFGEGKNDLRDWNDGKIRMLLTHPASAGHGLNFQYGGNIGVWYGMPWSLELYQQFMKRLHRSGQEAEAVVMHRILARDTVDWSVVDTVGQKGVTQDAITEAVRVHVERTQQWMKMAA